MKRMRAIGRVVFAIVAAAPCLLLVQCDGSTPIESIALGLACASAADCPYYLTCAEGQCRSRCAPSSCRYSETCRAGACFPDPSKGSGGVSPGASANACASLLAPVRNDMPVSSSSTSNLAFDATHVYAATVINDALGNPHPGLYVAALDGSGSFRAIWAPPNTSGGSGISTLFRSGPWLYFRDYTSATLRRLPAPPPDPAPAPEDVGVPADVLGSNATDFVLQGSTMVEGPGDAGMPVNSIFRVDGTSSLVQTPPLDAIPSLFSATETRFAWVFPAGGGEVSRIGKPGEVITAAVPNGPAVASGVFLPTNTAITTFVASGPYVLVTTPNGTVLRLDTTTPGAGPITLLSGGGTSTLGTIANDGFAYTFTSPSESSYECQQLTRVSLADSTQKTLAAVPTGASILAVSPDSIFLGNPYGGGGTGLYRVRKP